MKNSSHDWRPLAAVLLTVAAAARPGSPEAATLNGVAPVACFNVGPFQAPSSANFSVDATCSHDDATLTVDLEVRWDWENDGVWDFPTSGYVIGKKATHVFGTAGTRTIKLEVRDGEGLASQTTRTIVVGGDTTISESRFSGNSGVGEVSLAVDPANPDCVGIAANNAPPFFSTNGGTSCTGSTTPEVGNDPRVVFDFSGAIYFTKMRQGAKDAVRVLKSTDGGKTYPSTVDINVTGQTITMQGGGTGTICGNSVDFPVLGADSNSGSPYRDNVYVIVASGVDPGGGCTAYGAFWRSADHGATWTGRAFDTGTVSSLPIAPDGTLWIVGKGYPYCGASNINFIKSTDGGVTFTNGCVPSTFGGSQFSAVAIDPGDSNNVWMVMMANTSGVNSIYVARSTDAGANWSGWVRVDDVLAPDNVNKSYPAIGVTRAGGQTRVHVAWVDPRNAAVGTQESDIYYSYSTDGGVTWAPNIKASPAVSPRFFLVPGNDYITLAAAGSRVHIGYASDRDGNFVWEGYDVTVTTPAPAKPGAPVDPTVTATTVNTLEWSPPASDGNSPLTSVTVYRGTSPGTATLLSTLGGQATSFIDNSIVAGQTYSYQVSATNANGDGPRSREVAPLGAPTGLVVFGFQSSIVLWWSAPANDGGTSVTDYDIYRSNSSGAETFLARIPANVTYSDTTVTTGQTYFYKLNAVGATGEGPASNEASATAAGSPSPPQGFLATGGNGVVNLQWQPPASSGGVPIAHYYIYRGTTSGGEGANVIAILGNVTSYANGQVTNGTTYFYLVTAVNSAGNEGSYSSEASATPGAPPDLFFVCPATTTTFGTTTNCANMQNSADGSAVATLAETKTGNKWRFDQTYNSDGAGPAGTTHTLQIRGRVVATNAEQLDVQVFNFGTSSWTTRFSFLTSDTSLTLKTYALIPNEWNNGSPRIRFLHTTNDNSQSTWMIDYAKVVTAF